MILAAVAYRCGGYCSPDEVPGEGNAVAARPSTPLATARHAAGFSQEALATALGVDRGTVGRWERGVHAPYPWQRRSLATALGITLAELADLVDRTERHEVAPRPAHRQSAADPGTQVAEPDLVHAAVPRLRRALDRFDLPDDVPAPDLVELRAAVAKANDDRLQSRYGALARTLPDLVTALAHADTGSRDHAALLAFALRAADGMAFKFGYLDLSARLINLMSAAAKRADNPLLVAAAAYVRTETFFASGDLSPAARALEQAADRVPTKGVESLATFGSLHMRAAVVNARAGRADRAAEHLREARRAAAGVPEGNYLGTAFGFASLRIHELSVATELRDPLGIERAAAWAPPRALPAERRSHYYVDLARGHLSLGQHERAHLSLQAARRVAPEHVRAHPQVRGSLSTLLRVHDRPTPELLDLAAWARVR